MGRSLIIILVANDHGGFKRDAHAVSSCNSLLLVLIYVAKQVIS